MIKRLALSRVLLLALSMIMLTSSLAGCGSKGPLYIPAPGSEAEKKSEEEKKP